MLEPEVERRLVMVVNVRSSAACGAPRLSYNHSCALRIDMLLNRSDSLAFEDCRHLPSSNNRRKNFQSYLYSPEEDGLEATGLTTHIPASTRVAVGALVRPKTSLARGKLGQGCCRRKLEASQDVLFSLMYVYPPPRLSQSRHFTHAV
jgi:hypothetical protein